MGPKWIPKLTKTNMKQSFRAWLPCVASDRRKKTDDLEEKPQESRTANARYSGAARRRYKKQLQKEAGERAAQTITQQNDAAANTPGTEDGGPSRAVKR